MITDDEGGFCGATTQQCECECDIHKKCMYIVL